MASVATTDIVAYMENYIMKNCLWQFHSRAWDRLRQNEKIIGITSQLLCGEEVDLSTPEQKCYWIDSVILAENYKKNVPALADMSVEEIKDVMTQLKDRIDYLTVNGSLNLELTDKHY